MQTETEGILVVDKDAGMTSHDVVSRLRRIFKMRRIGHCGTLDPLATGVLVVCLGGFTRLNQWLARTDKAYRACLHLGATSDTGDADGRIQPHAGAGVVPDQHRIEQQLAALTGSYDQVPPAFSAVKVHGVPSHRLARENKAVALTARRITVKKMALLRYAWPAVELEIGCSKGTYIRAIAMDLGARLGCGAYITALHRTQVGALDETHAWTLAQIEQKVAAGQWAELFVHPAHCLDGMPHIVLEPRQLARFGNGQAVALSADYAVHQRQTCAVFDRNQRLHGIGRWTLEGSLLNPIKVFPDG